MTVSENEPMGVEVSEAQNLRERGAQIAAMVEAEAAEAEAETEAETEAEPAAYPCPVCGSEIDIPNQPKQDPNTERCTQCDGWGMTASGSLIPDAAVGPCSLCSGRGYNNVAPVYVPPSEFTHGGGETPRRVEAVNPEFPPLVVPDLSQVKVG